MSIFKGSGVAIVTPFNKDNSINFNSLEKLINFQIENGTDAIIVCGTTGESSTLTDEEQIEVIKFTVNTVNKKVPVIAGTGSNDTKHCIKLSKESQGVGADGLLIVTPYYNKVTQKGLINFYKNISNSVDLPIIMYNVPSRTGVNIDVDTVFELSKVQNIVGIKEASSNISQIAKICTFSDENFYIYSGNDEQILPILSLGGKGAISVLSNIAPKQVHNMVDLFLKSNVDESRKIQLESIELINRLFCEVNPIPVKAALNLMGFDAGILREPLTYIEPQNLILLEKAMKDYGIQF